MSRTIRRKTSKNYSYWIESKEEFDLGYNAHLNQTTCPEPPRPYPERPMIRVPSMFSGRFVWKEVGYDSYNTPEYKKFSRKTAEWWYDRRNAPEYIAYQAGVTHQRWGLGKASYAAYTRAERAMFHSDNGHTTHSRNTPRDFRNWHFTRPHRQETRALIHYGMIHDNWDEMNFPVQKRDAGWWYY